MNTRREFIAKSGILTAGLASMPGKLLNASNAENTHVIKDVSIDKACYD